MSDPLVKETVKLLRGNLGDKAGVLVRESAEVSSLARSARDATDNPGFLQCLLAISITSAPFITLSDINEIITPALKAIELADHVTRRALSRLISSLLVATQVEGSAAPIIAPKKKKGEEENDSYPTIGVPAASDGHHKTLLTPVEMMALLSSVYNKPGTSRHTRNGILDVYSTLFTNLGTSWVEHYYSDTIQHLIAEIGCGMAAGSGYSGWNSRLAERTEPSKARYDCLVARKAVGILLRQVLSGRLLSEPGQINAIIEIATLYLKKWPSLLPTQPSPSKQSLVIALDEVAGLLSSLGCAPSAVQDVLNDALVRLISHPSHTIQISAAWTLRSLCAVAPTKLSSTINHVVELLSKELSLLSTPASTPESSRRVVGQAHALAALINIIPQQPLYVSFDVSAKCMSLAIQLLKQSSHHELRVSGVEIQVVWIIVASLMSLGPHFVRLHLPQLLILWRNALPKPTSKDASAAQVRGDHEWAFLLHVRECTLGSMLSFLQHNGGATKGSTTSLINEDVGRRLAALLSNALVFSTSFATSRPNVAADPAPASGLSLMDRDVMYRRRVLQCLVALGQNVATRSLQVTLLQQVVVNFSDPDIHLVEAGGVATYSSVWDQVDGIGYGITTLLREDSVDVAGGDDLDEEKKSIRLNRDLVEAEIEGLLKLSVLDAAEHDDMVLSSSMNGTSAPPSPTVQSALPTRPPPAAGVVDASIELFCQYFPLQEAPNQGALLQSLLNNLRSARLEKNPGRRTAILSNSLTAILGCLRVIMRASVGASRKPLDPAVGNLMREFIKEALLSSEARLRLAGAETIGRLSALGSTAFMASQIQFCVNQVVTNTDPSNRAGCALAFGEIYSHVGGLAAGPVLKTIVEVLLSLAADPHPLVHYYALQALSQVIGSASTSYSPFTNPTLGLLGKLYMSESHEPEGGSAGSVNLRGNLPAYQAMCRVMDEVIGVLGPELQESERVRSLVLTLLKELGREADEGIIVEAIKATQHFLMFSSSSIDYAQLITTLRSRLSSSTRQPLRAAAVNSIYSLVQRDAALMSKLGGDGLVSELFALLDDDPSIEGVRDAIVSWLRQTADANPSGWIDVCQRIISRSVASKAAAVAEVPGLMNFTDEESQGLGLESEGGVRPGAPGARPASRWRTQLFALQCLHQIFSTVILGGRREHFDLVTAKVGRVNRKGLLVHRVSDLIKMAFTASTAQVMEIRLEGLVVLRNVIEVDHSSLSAVSCAEADSPAWHLVEL